MKKIILFILFIPLVSCKDVTAVEPVLLDFYFENPQPIHDSELSKFPNYFQGTYRNSDSTSIIIGDKFIFSERDYGIKIHKKDLDSIKDVFEFINGKLIDKETNKPMTSHFVGDSLSIDIKHIDTLFFISEKNKVKRINGNLILNKKDSIYWKIKMLSLEKNILKFKYLCDNLDVVKIDSITKIKAKGIDSSSYIFNPSRSEFKKILKLKNLGGENEFKKYPNEIIKKEF